MFPISVKGDDAEWIAWLLIEHGYRQTSRRWRLVARLPVGESPMEAIVRVRSREGKSLVGLETVTNDVEAARLFCRDHAGSDGLALMLPRHVFDAFRRLGGKAW